jgi:hypothetical protein
VFAPTDRGRRARRRPWRRAGLRRAPRACPVLTCTFAHWGSPCARATTRSTHGRSWIGRPHQRRVVIAAPAPAPTTPRTPSPFCARPSSKHPKGSPRATGWSPGARRCGTSPPAGPCLAAATSSAFRGTLGLSSKTAGDLSTPGATRGSDHNRCARIRCGPPLVPQPHACPHGTQPHRQPKDPMRLASRGPATARTAGIPAAPAIRGSRASGPVKGGFDLF